MAGGLHLLRYEEGSYTGDVNDAKNPEGQVGGRRELGLTQNFDLMMALKDKKCGHQQHCSSVT